MRYSEDSGFTLETENQDGQKETITAEQCLVATGVVPNSDLLDLEKAGIKTKKGGFIDVDPYLRTSAENVWALGDIAGTLTQLAYDRETGFGVCWEHNVVDWWASRLVSNLSGVAAHLSLSLFPPPSFRSCSPCVGNYLFRHSVNFEGEYLYETVLAKVGNHPQAVDPYPVDYTGMPHAVFSYPQVAGYVLVRTRSGKLSQEDVFQCGSISQFSYHRCSHHPPA